MKTTLIVTPKSILAETETRFDVEIFSGKNLLDSKNNLTAEKLGDFTNESMIKFPGIRAKYRKIGGK